MESGRMIKPTDMEYTDIKTEQLTTVIGKTISSMAKVLRNGTMEVFMMASTSKARNMDLAFTCGMISPSSLGNGTRIKYQESEFILGSTVECTRESGKTIIWKGMESINGETAESTKGSIKKTKNMGSGYTIGPMGESTKDIGQLVSNMG